MNVIETTRYHADNDPEATPFTYPVDAQRHGERIAIAKKVEDHLLGLYGSRCDIGDITLAAYVELVAIVQRETPV